VSSAPAAPASTSPPAGRIRIHTQQKARGECNADAPAVEVVETLRLQAFSALMYADAVADRDKHTAALAREDACRLRCQAAVIEALSTQYDELGLQAQRWGEFAEKMTKPL
jgi:hypothetical protein